MTEQLNGTESAPTKRHRLAKGIQNQDTYIRCLQKTHFRSQETYIVKVRVWKKVFHANGNQKKAGVAILIPDKMDVKTKTVIRDKEGHSVQLLSHVQLFVTP